MLLDMGVDMVMLFSLIPLICQVDRSIAGGAPVLRHEDGTLGVYQPLGLVDIHPVCLLIYIYI